MSGQRGFQTHVMLLQLHPYQGETTETKGGDIFRTHPQHVQEEAHKAVQFIEAFALYDESARQEKIDVLDNNEATNYSHLRRLLHGCIHWQAI